jgi:hypothetical protein
MPKLPRSRVKLHTLKRKLPDSNGSTSYFNDMTPDMKAQVTATFMTLYPRQPVVDCGCPSGCRWLIFGHALHRKKTKIIQESGVGDNGNRTQSQTLWKQLEIFEITPKHKASDMSHLKACIIDSLDKGRKCFLPVILKEIQGMIRACMPLNSQSNWFCDLHKYVKDTKRNLDQYVMFRCSLNIGIQNARKRRSNGRSVTAKWNAQQILVTQQNVNTVVNRCMREDNKNIAEIVLGLICCIGTRKIGLIDTHVHFKAVKGDPHRLLQIGVLKRRNLEMCYEQPIDCEYIQIQHTKRNSLEKPIMFGFTSKHILDRINYIRAKVWQRSEFKEKLLRLGVIFASKGGRCGAYHVAVKRHRAWLSTKTCSEFTGLVKTMFVTPSLQNSRLGTHFCRSIYANSAWAVNKEDPSSGSLCHFLSRVLGHEEGSLTTCTSYMNLRIFEEDLGIHTPKFVPIATFGADDEVIQTPWTDKELRLELRKRWKALRSNDRGGHAYIISSDNSKIHTNISQRLDFNDRLSRATKTLYEVRKYSPYITLTQALLKDAGYGVDLSRAAIENFIFYH